MDKIKISRRKDSIPFFELTTRLEGLMDVDELYPDGIEFVDDDSDCHSDCQGSQKESGSVPESNIADAEKPQ